MRVRWFNVVRAPIVLSTLRPKLLKDEYRESRSSGFRLDPSSRGGLAGRFIERIEYEVEVEDPFGRVEVQARVEYRQLRFQIFESAPHVQVSAPPRSCKAFLGRLSDHLSEDAQIRASEVPLEDWLSELERRVERSEVHLLEVSNIRLSGVAHARVLVAGVEDIRKAQRSFLKGHEATLERVGLSWNNGGARCELTGAGRALIETGEPDVVARVLRDALAVAEERDTGQLHF